MQNVVCTVIFVGTFNSGNITGILNNADYAFIPCVAFTDRAKLIIGKVTADFALLDFSMSVNYCLRKTPCLVFFKTENVKGKPLCSFMTYTGHTLKMVY